MNIGILHPGDVGTFLGEKLSSSHRIMWDSTGRSPATRERASTAGFVDAGDIPNLASECDALISACPPHSALEVAELVSDFRSRGLIYIDINSVAPRTMHQIAELFTESTVVDASLTGTPGNSSATIWLSGPNLFDASNMFTDAQIRCQVVGPEIGQASAFKMCAGLRSKVMTAVWATLIDTADAYGDNVKEALRTHLNEIGHDLDSQAAKVADRSWKAWRWIGEMEEISKTLDDVSMPSGFSDAAASTYRRIARQLDTE